MSPVSLIIKLNTMWNTPALKYNEQNRNNHDIVQCQEMLDAFLGKAIPNDPPIMTAFELQQKMITYFRSECCEFIGHAKNYSMSILHDDIEAEEYFLEQMKQSWQERKDKLRNIAQKYCLREDLSLCSIVGFFNISEEYKILPPNKDALSLVDVYHQMICTLNKLIFRIGQIIKEKRNYLNNGDYCVYALQGAIDACDDYVMLSINNDMSEHKYSQHTKLKNKHIKYHRDLLLNNPFYELENKYKSNKEGFAMAIATTPGCSKASLWEYLFSNKILETLDPSFGGEIWLKGEWKQHVALVDDMIIGTLAFLSNILNSSGKGIMVCCTYEALTQCDVAEKNALYDFVDHYNAMKEDKDRIAGSTISNNKGKVPKEYVGMAAAFIRTAFLSKSA